MKLHHDSREHLREPAEDEREGTTRERYRESFTIETSLDAAFEMAKDSDGLLGNFGVIEDARGRHVRAMLLHARIVSAAATAHPKLL